MIFFILFLSAPILEIYLFLKVSQYIGALETVLLIVLTAIVGSFFIKREGTKTINRIKTFSLSDPENLLKALGDGLFVVISGILLLTPGFITDLVGIALFFKSPRHYILNLLMKRINFSSYSKFKHDQSTKD